MGKILNRKRKLNELLLNKELPAEQRESLELQRQRMKVQLKQRATRYKQNKINKDDKPNIDSVHRYHKPIK